MLEFRWGRRNPDALENSNLYCKITENRPQIGLEHHHPPPGNQNYPSVYTTAESLFGVYQYIDREKP